MTPTSKTAPTSTETNLAMMQARFSASGVWQSKIRRRTSVAGWQIALFISAFGKRLSDVLLATLSLIVLSPLLILVAFLLRLDGGSIFACPTKVGRWSVPFRQIEFDTAGSLGRLIRRFQLHRLPVLINILHGDMSFIGPRAMCPEEMDVRQRAARKRSSVRPGVVSLWGLRKKANIHFGSELATDLEYIDDQTGFGDLGIALRTIPSVLFGGPSALAPTRVDVLGISVDNLTMEDALEYILNAATGDVARQLCFVNTDCINKSTHDDAYKELLQGADLVLADGIGIRLAGKISRREIRQNVNGTDLFPLLCQRLQGAKPGLFLLGARPEVVANLAEWVQTHHPAPA